MNITSFSPLITIKDAASSIQLFEALGFERYPTKEGDRRGSAADVQMKDANGFRVDISPGDGEWTLGRMNVDDQEQVLPLLEACGFRETKNKDAKETNGAGSSRFNIMVSVSRFILAVSQTPKDQD